MKKTMKLWLFMLIMLLLTGCGNNGDSSDTTERKEDESSTSIEVENNEDNRMEEPAWDTKWASNEFENLIPQPPFNGWKGEKKSDYEYEMVTSEANADGSGNYYEEFQTYVLSLKDLGFEVEGDFNEFNVKDSKGNKIEADFADFFPFKEKEWIDIIYFDPFSPETQPQSWNEEIFQRLYNAVKPYGRLVTYSAKGIVKQALRKCGFEVIRIKGAGKKRHSLVAIKNQADIQLNPPE